MSLSDVQHQPRAHRMLQRALVSQRMPHAYLFSGPEGVGKETMAVGLAQVLLCSSPTTVKAAGRNEPGSEPMVDACGQCQDCRLVAANTHPDLFLIHRQLGKQHPEAEIRKRMATQLSVEVIRHFLIVQAGHKPMRGKAKVFVVREAERMSDSAQNALLKTLEEPPPGTFIILLTSAQDRMLPTTRSRCQQVAFQPLPVAFVEEQLVALRPEAPQPARTYAARHTGGSLGQALRDLDDGIYAMKQAWGQRLADLTSAGPEFAAHSLAGPFEADAKSLAKLIGERDPDVSDTDATRAGLRTMLAMLADFYTDALRRTEGALLPEVNADQPEVIASLAKSGSAGSSLRALRELAEADANIGRNANIQLATESLFIRLRQAAK